MSSAQILGIDPGFASLGYAVLNLDATGPTVATLGVLRTAKTDKKHRVLAADDNVRRCRELALPLAQLMLSGAVGYVAPPAGVAGFVERMRTTSTLSLVCAEKMSFPRNASAAAKMAMSWGMIVAYLHHHGLPLIQASPQDVKRRVTGSSSASKEEVQKALIKRFGRGLLRMLKGIPEGQHEHAFDALAAAVACLDSEEGRIVQTLARHEPR